MSEAKPNHPNESAEQEEFGLSDRLLGAITSPAETFEEIAKRPVKTTHWLLPFLFISIAAAVMVVVMMRDPEIRQEARRAQMEQIDERFDEAVKSGEMTRAEADQQKEMIRKQMGKMGGLMPVISAVSVFLFGFIIFFVVSAVHFLIARFALGGEGGYQHALVANATVAYISIIGILVTLALALATGSGFDSLGLGALAGLEKGTAARFWINRIDVFYLWALVVTGVGLAKLYKSEKTGAYVGSLFALYLVWSLAVFFLKDTLPFLQNFAR
ncbi:MAG: hypothetical protein GF419_10330 [Ignavibacteriales bacterium]|nr:hypothetical protein [Ignavibacteriales bacterium]